MLSTTRRTFTFATLLLAGCASGDVATTPRDAASRTAAAAGKPRLVVLISIDQFRADYLTRFADLFLPAGADGRSGGFRRLMERGAWYSDAHHDHFPLFTGPGHAAISTGAQPSLTGIVGNSWADQITGKEIYCVRDDTPLGAIVGGSGPGVSPRSLRTSTIGDELEIATGGRAKTWSVALKDRAAVLLGGHLADGVVWFDASSGAWVSSRWYCKSGELPAWATERTPAKDWTAAAWTTDLPVDVLSRAWLADDAHAKDAFHIGATFPHALAGGPGGDRAAYFKAYAATPLANDYVLDTALRIVDEEKLGQDDVPDLLTINLSSNDYLGHAFGPDSPEVLAMTVDTDRALARFLDGLLARVPGGWSATTVVVTGDHGVAPIAEATRDAGFDAGRYDEGAMQAAVVAALKSRMKSGSTWGCRVVESNVYLDHAALTCPIAEADEAAAEALRGIPGVAAAFARDDVEHGRVPPTEIAARVANGINPRVSGDVIVVPSPFWLPADKTYATTHGAPYPYDTSVPILYCGAGVAAPGRYRVRVSTLDIAATLADELGVLQPSGCTGRVLPHAGLHP